MKKEDLTKGTEVFNGGGAIAINVKHFSDYTLVLAGTPDNRYVIWEVCGPDYNALADGRDHGLYYDDLVEAVKVFKAWVLEENKTGTNMKGQIVRFYDKQGALVDRWTDQDDRPYTSLVENIEEVLTGRACPSVVSAKWVGIDGSEMVARVDGKDVVINKITDLSILGPEVTDEEIRKDLQKKYGSFPVDLKKEIEAARAQITTIIHETYTEYATLETGLVGDYLVQAIRAIDKAITVTEIKRKDAVKAALESCPKCGADWEHDCSTETCKDGTVYTQCAGCGETFKSKVTDVKVRS